MSERSGRMMSGPEGRCWCEPQVVSPKCAACWRYVRRGNTLLSWAYLDHNHKPIVVMNLSALWSALSQRKWQAVKNMLRVLVFERPKVAWKRDWTSWMDTYTRESLEEEP